MIETKRGEMHFYDVAALYSPDWPSSVPQMEDASLRREWIWVQCRSEGFFESKRYEGAVASGAIVDAESAARAMVYCEFQGGRKRYDLAHKKVIEVNLWMKDKN